MRNFSNRSNKTGKQVYNLHKMVAQERDVDAMVAERDMVMAACKLEMESFFFEWLVVKETAD
jgi:hypothetical protein